MSKSIDTGDTITVQLNIETGGFGFGDHLRGWFQGCLDALGGSLAERLHEAGPLANAALRNRPSNRPYGPPGSIWAHMVVGTRPHLQPIGDNGRRQRNEVRRRATAFSMSAWDTFLDKLGADTPEARFVLSPLDQDGFPGTGWPFLEISATVLDKAPGWAFLNARMPRASFVELRRQQALVSFLGEYGGTCNPSFGHVAFEHDRYQTPLEALKGAIPYQEVQKSRLFLRGYSWLTICAEETGQRLGGDIAMRGSGAFVEVRHLTAGGYLMLAAARYEEYGQAAAEKVFQALAPILPPGKPGKPFGSRPFLVVLKDSVEAVANH
jgi:hypothetical protein